MVITFLHQSLMSALRLSWAAGRAAPPSSWPCGPSYPGAFSDPHSQPPSVRWILVLPSPSPRLNKQSDQQRYFSGILLAKFFRICLGYSESEGSLEITRKFMGSWHVNHTEKEGKKNPNNRGGNPSYKQKIKRPPEYGISKT
jgi:hypothetical protein